MTYFGKAALSARLKRYSGGALYSAYEYAKETFEQ